jgi:hypothetical protein
MWGCSMEYPWFPEPEPGQSGLADRRARVPYKMPKGTPTKLLGKVQKSPILRI